MAKINNITKRYEKKTKTCRPEENKNIENLP